MDLKEQMEAARSALKERRAELRKVREAADAVFQAYIKPAEDALSKARAEAQAAREEATKAASAAERDAEEAARAADRRYAESISPFKIGERYDTRGQGKYAPWGGGIVEVVSIHLHYEIHGRDSVMVEVAMVRKDGKLANRDTLKESDFNVSRYWRKVEGQECSAT